MPTGSEQGTSLRIERFSTCAGQIAVARYLHVGEPRKADGEETPEGHLLRFASGSQDVVGLTLVGARALLKRDGRLTVTETVEASSEVLAGALGPV